MNRWVRAVLMTVTALTLVVVGLSMLSAGDASAGANGHWTGYWTFIPTAWKWVWTWVWVATNPSFTVS